MISRKAGIDTGIVRSEMKEISLKIHTYGDVLSVEQKIVLDPKDEPKRGRIAALIAEIVEEISPKAVTPLPVNPQVPSSPSG